MDDRRLQAVPARDARDPSWCADCSGSDSVSLTFGFALGQKQYKHANKAREKDKERAYCKQTVQSEAAVFVHLCIMVLCEHILCMCVFVHVCVCVCVHACAYVN